MKNKRICFHVGEANHENIYLAEYLKGKGFIVSFICYKSYQIERFHDIGNEAFSLEFENKQVIEKNEENAILKWFKERANMDFREIYFSELLFVGRTKQNEKLLKERVLRKIKIAKHILDSGFKSDFFIDFAGDEIDHNIFKIIAHVAKGRLIRYRETVFPERIGFMENKLGVWKIPQFDVLIPSKEEKTYIEGFVNQYLEQKKVFWGTPQERDFKLKVKTNNLSQKIFDRNVYKRFISRMNRYLNKLRAEHIYQDKKVLEGLKYFYFPLHYPIDSQLTYRGRPFINQIDFAELLVEFLPEDYNLVIKEHPHARGAISVKDLKRVKRNKRAYLLHPWINSHNILENSKAVFVINSTVALEAIYKGIPVLSFGNSYFSGHQLVEEMKSFYDLYELYNWKPKHEKEYLKKRLNSFLIQGLRNSISVSNRKMLTGALDEEEVRIFSDGLIDYIMK